MPIFLTLATSLLLLELAEKWDRLPAEKPSSFTATWYALLAGIPYTLLPGCAASVRFNGGSGLLVSPAALGCLTSYSSSKGLSLAGRALVESLLAGWPKEIYLDALACASPMPCPPKCAAGVRLPDTEFLAAKVLAAGSSMVDSPATEV